MIARLVSRFVSLLRVGAVLAGRVTGLKWKPLAVMAILAVSMVPLSAGASTTSAYPIQHVIVIMQENHTFDNYFGTYPGANGIADARPQPVAANSTLTVKPFEINSSVLPSDICHSNACALRAYANGSMNGFITAQGRNLTMGYFNPRFIGYYWDYASQYVLMDDFFSSAMGPSLPNHLYLIAGQSGGMMGDVTGATLHFNSSLVYNNTFHFNSIVDELAARGISWRYYAGGFQSLNDWNPLPAFQSVEANRTMMRNLVDPSSFITDLNQNRLPAVSWVMPVTESLSEHPPYNVTQGEQSVVAEVNAVMTSSYWKSSAIFVTWDDYGGWYDHVAPPQVDRYGYGFRLPCLVISPYTKQGYIDGTQSDDTSILKFIETVWSLPSLTTRDAQASNFLEAFNFSQSPRAPLVLPGPYVPNHYPLTLRNQTGTSGSGTRTQSGSSTTPSPGEVAFSVGDPVLAGLLLVLMVAGAFIAVEAAGAVRKRDTVRSGRT